MTNIIIEYPVKTLDGIELLPESTELTEETLEELAKGNASVSYHMNLCLLWITEESDRTY